MTPPRALPVLALATALPLLSCTGPELRVIESRGVTSIEPAGLEDMPEVREPDASDDFLEHAVRRPLRYVVIPPRALRDWLGRKVEAYNPTSTDDVVDSSWFRRRNSRRRMTPAQVARGPDPGVGPDTSGDWTVTGAKIGGITPGFRIRDAAGVGYLIKFDPPGHPELMSSAEAISQRLFYAAGYHTPPTYVTYFDPARVRASATLMFEDPLGREMSVTDADLQELLRGFPRGADGRIRAAASRILDGTPIGPFSYEGTRDDDPTDTVPHQHRRELRGLYVVAAWLNHVDAKQLNTLDMVVEEGGRRFVKHYLIDFGSTLWSSSIYPNDARDGVEFDVDLGRIAARLITGGIYTASWERYEGEASDGALGFYSADLFDPGAWRTNYSNPAFKRATIRDGYWGAKLVASFDAEQIRAAVATGRLSDPAAAEALTRAILARRDLTVRYWFKRVTPLEELEIVGTPGVDALALTFRDLAVAEGAVPAAGRHYRVRFELSAAGIELDALRRPEITPDGVGRFELPDLLGSHGSGSGELWERLQALSVEERLGKLEVEAIAASGQPNARSVRIYLLPDRGRGYRIVGRAY